MSRGILGAWLHHRVTLRDRWRRLDGEQRAAVVFVAIEAVLVLFVVGASLGWWTR